MRIKQFVISGYYTVALITSHLDFWDRIKARNKRLIGVFQGGFRIKHATEQRRRQISHCTQKPDTHLKASTKEGKRL